MLTRVPRQVVAWGLPLWSRGLPGRPTPPDLFRVLYTAWLVAFVLKVLGASWDVSWHFRWLRDDLAPPHLINTVGTMIVVGLTIVHWYTGYGVDKAAQRLILWGTGTFLVAIPLDLINHNINGLDITAWSPSHALLFIGTAFMIAGVIRGWYVGAPPGRQRTVVLAALFGFFLENAIFPSEHQEYGVIGLAAWVRGAPEADTELLNFAADQLKRPVDTIAVQNFALPVPDQVYSLWAVIVGMAILVAARMATRYRFTATFIVAGYLAFRMVIWPLLVGTGFPGSAIPFFLLLGAIFVDLAFLVPRMWARIVVGSLLVTGGAFAGLWLQDTYVIAPPYAPWAWPYAIGGLAVAWLVVELAGKRLSRPSA